MYSEKKQIDQVKEVKMLANSFFAAADDIGGTGSTNLTVDVSTNYLNLKSIHHTHTYTRKNKRKHFSFIFIN